MLYSRCCRRAGMSDLLERGGPKTAGPPGGPLGTSAGGAAVVWKQQQQPIPESILRTTRLPAEVVCCVKMAAQCHFAGCGCDSSLKDCVANMRRPTGGHAPTAGGPCTKDQCGCPSQWLHRILNAKRPAKGLLKRRDPVTGESPLQREIVGGRSPVQPDVSSATARHLSF